MMIFSSFAFYSIYLHGNIASASNTWSQELIAIPIYLLLLLHINHQSFQKLQQKNMPCITTRKGSIVDPLDLF